LAKGDQVATLREIARRAGVSIRTVSRALSGAADVRAETRVAIEHIAKDLRYTPNPMARGLKLRRGYVVPVIVRQPEELAFAKVCVLERELRSAGYTTQLIFNAGGAESEAEHLQEALAYRPAAVVLFSAARGDDAGHLRGLHDSGTPYVLIDRRPLPGLDAVSIDRAAGVANAVGHLLAGDHRNVFYLGPAQRDERTEGFARAFRKLRLRPPRNWAMTGCQAGFEGGRAAGRELVRRHPEATAAFVYSDLMAYGVLRGLAECGVGVPGRMSVAGFDDRSPSRYVSPPLSTVAHPHDEVGRLAAEVLLGKINGEIRPGQGSRVAVPRFVPRESTRELD
jgi:DNA-binding LacI/PurR family transcriptional regulator